MTLRTIAAPSTVDIGELRTVVPSCVKSYMTAVNPAVACKRDILSRIAVAVRREASKDARHSDSIGTGPGHSGLDS